MIPIYSDGRLIVTLTADGATLPDGTTRPLTEDEAATVEAWQAQQAMPLTIEDRIARLEAAVFGTPDGDGLIPAPPVEDAPDWTPPTGAHDAVEPNGTRRFPDGTVRRNVSGTWLAHGPDEHPRGWQTIIPAPGTGTPIPAWDPERSYQPGDVVTHAGRTWDATHWANPGDEPGDPTMWAVWKARTP